MSNGLQAEALKLYDAGIVARAKLVVRLEGEACKSFSDERCSQVRQGNKREPRNTI